MRQTENEINSAVATRENAWAPTLQAAMDLAAEELQYKKAALAGMPTRLYSHRGQRLAVIGSTIKSSTHLQTVACSSIIGRIANALRLRRLRIICLIGRRKMPYREVI